MSTSISDNWGARLLTVLARLIIRRRSWFIWPQVILFVLCIVYTVFYLQFDTTRSSLVGANKKYHQLFQAFKKEFPTQDDMVVVVESDNAEKNRQFVERLGAKIEAARTRVPVRPGAQETVETNLFARVFYKGDLKMLGAKALLFVPGEDLAALKQRLEDYRPFIQPFTGTTNLVSLFDMINTQFRTASRESSQQTDSLVRALPALERIILQANASLKRSGSPPSPGVFALFDAGRQAEQSVYITFADGRIYLCTAQALTADLNREAMSRLRQLLEETRVEVSGVNAGLTGEPVLELDEMEQSQKDTTIASIVSLVICALIFIYGYNETGRPLKATVCLIIGIAYTMAFTTAAVGHLNILTITFVPILIGLAIDFGVHLVTRFEEELRNGRTPEEAVTKALVFTGQGIFTGAFTTAGAFLAMFLTDFRGIQEMGIICGGGLLVCLIPMMTLLPALLLRGRQNVIDHKTSGVDSRERIERLWLQRPLLVITLTVLTCAICATQFYKVYFDYNLLNMQSAGLPAVEFEEKLIEAAQIASSDTHTNANGRSVLFAAVITDSVAQAVEMEKRLKTLPAVAEVDSIAKFLAENPSTQLKLIGEIKDGLASIHFKPADTNAVNVSELSQSLFSLRGYCGLAQQEAEKDAPEIAARLAALKKAIDTFRKEMFRLGPAGKEAVAEKLGDYQRALFADLRETFEALQTQDNREGMRVEDLPSALRERFVGIHGKQLIQVYPKENVWERKHQMEFVEQLRTVDENVTGTPVQLLEYTSLLKKSYENAALYSLGAIVLLVFIHFRSVGSVVLALVPVLVGSVWLLGVMGAFDIPFNPANIMTLPLVIGIGVTNGIHILNRFAEEHSPSILAKSTGKAVLVSGLTTIAGFGSLVLAKHQGIESLGWVMSTGVATCMLAGLTFLPAILTLMTNRPDRGKNQPSADNAQSTLGREEPR
jgi:hopanoid biosynthesis associated RND transporter like protein HpnN